VTKSAAQPAHDGQDKRNNRATAIAVAVVGLLVCALGVLGGIGSFTTVRHLAEPWFGAAAWTVPVGIDLGILALLAWDLLTEYLGLSWPLTRWTAWAFVAATIYLNVAAARGNPNAAVMHAAMPVLFVTVIEGIRHLVQQRTGIATGTRIERIPVSRWLLAPHTTFLLARRMVLWHVTSYHDGLTFEYQRLLAVSHLQQAHGRWRWRWRAPLNDRLALRLMPTDITIRPLPDEDRQPDSADTRLIEATATILANAERDGTSLSQAALARQLRERGHRVGNDRLHSLITTARAVLTDDTQHSEAA
jgi:hypothetical protein